MDDTSNPATERHLTGLGDAIDPVPLHRGASQVLLQLARLMGRQAAAEVHRGDAAMKRDIR
jgi:hypothetical protein